MEDMGRDIERKVDEGVDFSSEPVDAEESEMEEKMDATDDTSEEY